MIGTVRRDERGSTHRLRREQPLNDRSAHRMADQHGRRRKRLCNVLDVRHEIVEPRDEQRLDAPRPAVPA